VPGKARRLARSRNPRIAELFVGFGGRLRRRLGQGAGSATANTQAVTPELSGKILNVEKSRHRQGASAHTERSGRDHSIGTGVARDGVKLEETLGYHKVVR